MSSLPSWGCLSDSHGTTIRTRQEHSYGCLWLFCENLDTLLREAVCYLSFVLLIHAEVCGKQIEFRAPFNRILFYRVPQNVLEGAE